jgi:choline-sulfatase
MNILILMTDQHRYDCLGCAGHPQLKTPNIDRLAEEGLRFNQATTVSPVCTPARISFLNGLYPHNHGVWTNSGELPASDETFFQLLQKNGYYNAHIGKAHYYTHKNGEDLRKHTDYMFNRGFDYIHETTGPQASCSTTSVLTDYWQNKGVWEAFKQDYSDINQSRQAGKKMITRASALSEEDHLDAYIGQSAVEFIDNYKEAKPFCMFIGFGGPHEPFDPPGKYASMYDPVQTPLPTKATEQLTELEKKHPDMIPNVECSLEEVQEIRSHYYGKISLIDDWIGRIIERLDKRGQLDDTCIVFWSDHGEMLGDHGRLYKQNFYEESVRVPLIIRHPDRKPPTPENQTLVEIIDIFPTILDIAACPPSTRCLGKSLLPLFDNPDYTLRDSQLSEIEYMGCVTKQFRGMRNTMIRTEQYKYVVDQNCQAYMLFDLKKDPKEEHNLIGTKNNRKIESKMRELLLKKLIETQYSLRDNE